MLRRFLLLLSAAFLSACGSAKGPQELRVGMELAYPPFEMTDPQGQPAGVSVDLARAFGDAAHRPVRIENIPFAGLIPALRTGKIDLIISSLTVTEERQAAMDFSDPYLTTGLAMLVSANSSVQKVEDLQAAGRTVAVKKGTTGYFYAAKNLPSAKLLQLDQESSCVLEVVQGKADAFLYDQLSTLQHWQQNRGTTRALLQPITTERWAIGLRKGNEALRADVNRFLRQYQADGGLQKLGDRWLGEQKKAFADLGIPFVF